MKKIVLFFMLGAFVNIYGQPNFMHAVGGGSYFTTQEAAAALMYAPRLNFVEFSNETSLSVGTNLGFMYLFNSDKDKRKFAMDIPGLVQVNFGAAATPFSYSSFGGFVGGGFGYNSIGTANVFGNYANKSFGPVYTAGVRLRIGYRVVEARVSYLQAINRTDATDVLGIGGLFVFGGY